MALSMSIVNLDRSVRAQFDQRIDRINRRMQTEHRNRAYQLDNEAQQSADVPDETSHDADINQTQDEITQATSPQPSTNSEPNGTPTSNTDEQENQNPDTQPQQSTQGIEIAVDYEELAANPGPPEEDERSETAEIDQEINSLSDNGDRSLTCCEFYRKHWVGNLITGCFSGFLFILLGVIFLVNGDDFPFYAGIMLIVLGLAPCCMALNRYRYARLYERERRRALQRLHALRRAHRHNLREGRRRQRYSDLPPSYDNLGFELNETDVEMDNFSVATAGSFVLPTYDQFMKKSKEKQDTKSAKGRKSAIMKDDESRHDEDSVPPPNYSESITAVGRPIQQSEQQEFVEIEMPMDSIQITESSRQDNTTELVDQNRSIASPTDSNNNSDNETSTATPTCDSMQHTESTRGLSNNETNTNESVDAEV